MRSRLPPIKSAFFVITFIFLFFRCQIFSEIKFFLKPFKHSQELIKNSNQYNKTNEAERTSGGQ